MNEWIRKWGMWSMAGLTALTLYFSQADWQRDLGLRPLTPAEKVQEWCEGGNVTQMVEREDDPRCR
jgi:hypothetical protein